MQVWEGRLCALGGAGLEAGRWAWGQGARQGAFAFSCFSGVFPGIFKEKEHGISLADFFFFL